MAAISGYPHITVPAGRDRGLPVGLSFVGTAFSEPLLIRAAHGYEQATRHAATLEDLPASVPPPGLQVLLPADQLEEVRALVEAGAIRPRIDRTFPLDEAAAALTRLADLIPDTEEATRLRSAASALRSGDRPGSADTASGSALAWSRSSRRSRASSSFWSTSGVIAPTAITPRAIEATTSAVRVR